MPTLSTNTDSYVSVAHKDGPDTLPPTRDPVYGKRGSWRAPTTMACALMLGLAVAIAQHFMYASLDRRPVSEVAVSQAWISRISTGLAFLVKVALTICVGAAFIQHQWLRLQQEPLRVTEVDTLTSALSNMFCFLQSTVLYRNPMLAIMALVSWTIPLGTIITPGALTVEPVRSIEKPQMQVPQPIYNFTNYGTIGVYNINEDSRLTKLLAYTAASRAPVPLRSSYQNQTYSLIFNGPALKCKAAGDSVTRNASITYGDIRGLADTYEFASWTGSYTPDRNAIGSYTPDRNASSSELNDGLGQAGNIYDPYGDNRTASFISVMTNIIGSSSNQTVFHSMDNFNQSAQAVNVTQCLLYNATYDVEFIFHYPNQTQTVRSLSWINTVSLLYSDPSWPTWPGPPNMSKDDDTLSYGAMMTAFGRLLVGSSYRSHYGKITNERTSWKILTIDWTRGEAVQQGLETLFQNFTLSLLSDAAFTKNFSMAASIPVQAETWPITYVYSRSDLFVAYGVSLLAALTCALVGLRAFSINNGSYQNLFSTYLRAASDAGLAYYTQTSDAGDDPLPKSLAEARVRMNSLLEKTTYSSSVEESELPGGGRLLQRRT